MRILIAEDDAMMQELLRTFVADLGHDFDSAENGEELVKLALANRPDLILTDLEMPGMRGDSMIAMIDMYPPLAGIPVIMITGASDSTLFDAGIPDEIPVLHKPVDFQKLKERIDAIASRPKA